METATKKSKEQVISEIKARMAAKKNDKKFTWTPQVKKEETASDVQATITELKANRTLKAVKKEDKKVYYKIQNLQDKLRGLKARENGQFITVAHLKEHKGLIIWYLKNKCSFRGLLNIKKAMELILKNVEAKKYTYNTEKSIKSKIYDITRANGLDQMEEDLRANYEIKTHDSTYNNPILSQFQDWKFDMQMS